jgi:diguanylate cyclase (GGDEF)-like protein
MTEAETAEPLVGRVLIADDDREFRRLLTRRATRMGLIVQQAENGQEAMDALEAGSFDVIVADLYMPKFSGLEVIQNAQERDPDLQALILTGAATVETAIEALRSGVYDYLTKPLESLSAFELALTRALERRHLITENKRLFTEIEKLAVTDPLTGLFNRRKLDEALDTEFERARRYGRPLSSVMIDLDGLKRINDTAGHPAGDKALEHVSKAIQGHVRRVDFPTRYGGDEFLILLPEVDKVEAAAIADRICSEIVKAEIEGVQLSVSAGVAQLLPAHENTDDFLRAADQALYQAKRSGGQRIAILEQD